MVAVPTVTTGDVNSNKYINKFLIRLPIKTHQEYFYLVHTSTNNDDFLDRAE
jgi:hypothetical protein